VHADADHIRRVDPALAQSLGHGVLEDGDVVVRVLQRPFRRQRRAAPWQALIDHAVSVLVNGAAQLRAVADAHHHRAPRFSPEINAYCVLFLRHDEDILLRKRRQKTTWPSRSSPSPADYFGGWVLCRSTNCGYSTR